jgi:single-strand DNA-binding protein
MKNHVQLIGHLGQNPEVFNTENNKKILKISVATSGTYKNEKGEKVTTTEWHNCVAFGTRAEIIEKYCMKGSNVMVHGSLKTRKYTAKDNTERYATEILISDILFLDKKA